MKHTVQEEKDDLTCRGFLSLHRLYAPVEHEGTGLCKNMWKSSPRKLSSYYYRKKKQKKKKKKSASREIQKKKKKKYLISKTYILTCPFELMLIKFILIQSMG
jgi:hypothetical protein